MTTDPVQQQVAEVLARTMPGWTENPDLEDPQSLDREINAECLRQGAGYAQALADAGLLPTGRTQWAWRTRHGERVTATIGGDEGLARRMAKNHGGTVQSRIVFTEPAPTAWRDA